MAELQQQAESLDDACTAAVDIETGEFLEVAGREDGSRIVRIALPRSPDTIRERYTGNLKDPFRAATAEEMSAHDADSKDERVVQALESKELRALLIAALWSATGKSPDAAAVDQATDYWRQAYKALL